MPGDVAVAAGHSVDPAGWRVLFDELMCLVAGRFGRVEPRRTAREFVLGLLSPLERKNCWQLAEHAGHGDPQAMQRLLRTAVWDADAVRDDVRAFVAARLGDTAGVLIPGETGFLKKGTGSAGVQRQYSGTAGRIENSQVGVFLSYAPARGRALVDRRIYLPESWTGDRLRCAAAGIPADVQFAAKAELALDMVTEAVTAGVPAAWVAGDEVYGDNGGFRAGAAALGLGYVLAVSCTHRIPAFPGGRRKLRAGHIAAALPARCWHRVSAGTGSKGPRWYDWAWASAHQPGHSLLIRRGSAGELAFYRCWSPAPVPLATLVRVAGLRWAVEESFQASKEPGRDGSLPGAHLDRLAPARHLGHARPRVPHGLRRPGSPRSARGSLPPRPPRRAYCADRSRDPSALRRPGPPPAARHQRHPALVQLAPAPPRPRPPKPLPAQTRRRTRPITK
jgi:SRSO17 transposase